MQYTLDKKTFLMKLRQHGYRGIVDFAKSSRIHRNTLNQYLRGKTVFASSFDKITRKLEIDPLDIIRPVADPKAKIRGLEQILPIVGLIIKHDKRIAVVLLGSRAKGKGRPHADWDIGITRSDDPIKGIEFLRLRGAVSDAAEDLVHEVDLVNLDASPAWFLKSIDYDPIFLGGSQRSLIHFKGVLDGVKRGNAA